MLVRSRDAEYLAVKSGSYCEVNKERGDGGQGVYWWKQHSRSGIRASGENKERPCMIRCRVEYEEGTVSSGNRVSFKDRGPL